jgi:hypothetical protein
MCAGLDAWFTSASGAPPDDLRFREERLQQRLGVQYFVRPPEFSETEGQSRIPLFGWEPFLRPGLRMQRRAERKGRQGWPSR